MPAFDCSSTSTIGTATTKGAATATRYNEGSCNSTWEPRTRQRQVSRSAWRFRIAAVQQTRGKGTTELPSTTSLRIQSAEQRHLRGRQRRTSGLTFGDLVSIIEREFVKGIRVQARCRAVRGRSGLDGTSEVDGRGRHGLTLSCTASDIFGSRNIKAQGNGKDALRQEGASSQRRWRHHHSL